MTIFSKSTLRIFLYMLVFYLINACKPSGGTQEEMGIGQEKQSLIDTLKYALKSELLDPWYPMAVDSIDGGFLSTFNYDFSAGENQDKMIVTQARHVWTNAKAFELYQEEEYFKSSAAHGLQFLQEKMWDDALGGFYWLVDKQGNLKLQGQEQKTAYGNSFGLYGLAAYVHAFRDSGALTLAKESFAWLEEHSHDPIHSGYFQHLAMDGTPIVRPADESTMSVLGFKDQNSSIHLLEAFTELYQVWPDSLLGERLKEMLYLIRDTIVTEKGYMTLFFTPDWQPVTFRDSTRAFILEHHNIDHVSFGHDVEIAYLMLEADHVMGLEDEETLTIGKKIIDHALDKGFDHEVGGFYDEGYYFKGAEDIEIIRDTKNWWAQAEGMNALLLMSLYFPDDPNDYYGKFLLQWDYINKYLIDHEHGDWYPGGLDKQPEMKEALKGHIWKSAYHNFRALANCIKMLEEGEL